MNSKTREIAAKDEEMQRVKAELQALQVCCPGITLQPVFAARHVAMKHRTGKRQGCCALSFTWVTVVR